MEGRGNEQRILLGDDREMSSAGNLDRIVTFQRATVSIDVFHEPVETWETLVEVFGGKHDVSAAEAFRAQEVGAQLTTRFKVRYSPALVDLNARDRLLFDSKLYNITGVREIQRNAWLEVDSVARDDLPAVVTSP
jgi:SPP1 family predicted phage head-tail adaptor